MYEIDIALTLGNSIRRNDESLFGLRCIITKPVLTGTVRLSVRASVMPSPFRCPAAGPRLRLETLLIHRRRSKSWRVWLRHRTRRIGERAAVRDQPRARK